MVSAQQKTRVFRWQFVSGYFRYLSCLCFLAALSGCASLITPKLTEALIEIKPGQYQLDREHATILFKVDHMGFSSFVGRFNQFDASLNFDPENIDSTRLEAVVDTASVDVNNEKFARALRGGFWLDSERFPQAYFKTTGVRSRSGKNIEFMGELTLLGVTKPIVLNVKVNGAANNLLTGKYTLGFLAEAKFLRSDFGLDRFSPAVGDEITLEIHAEFQRN